MYPETKFKTDRRATTGYSPNSIYNNLDQYFNSRNAGTSSGYEMSSTQDYRNKSFEYHEKYGGNAAGDSSNLLNKNNYGIPSKKSYAPQRKSLYTTPVSKTYSSHITSPKSYNANITSPTEGQKPKASLSAYNLIPKSLLNDDTKKPNSPKDTKTSTQNISKRNSIGQYPVSKMSHNKRNSVNYDNRRRSQSHPTKSKSDNVLQKPKLGVIGVLSAKKSLNEFSKRSSRVLNQQTEEINNLKARIQVNI
ncbi:hypothetical protein BCR36DRAFT_283436 [Piromyces finnis]|uniref:Uncharacterized protein n=1 Tax=Piromyces finnis TaxID=1754191 RepID=A0A1Y1VEF9_9FUNG|nr:hypothetical protein BCR36DRAFT_283436 [Piromyces finnis]|eukprot:ORX54207.1 hypothetical protein BCR36DRAFT_283436 [Piromyces finnis]